MTITKGNLTPAEATKAVFVSAILLLEEILKCNFCITCVGKVTSAERLSKDLIKLILSTDGTEIQCSFLFPEEIPGWEKKELLLTTSRNCPTPLDSSRLSELDLDGVTRLSRGYAENIALFLTELEQAGK